MTEIVEGALVFSFPESWIAARFDDPDGFACKTWKCSEIQGRVDIMAYDGDRLYLIEVKDFRCREHDLQIRLDPNRKDALWRVACRKLRDSFAILLAAYRSNDQVLATFGKAAFEDRASKVDVVLFLDRDAEAHKTATGFLSSANLRDRISKQLRPLGFECTVVGQDTMPQDHAWSVRDQAP